MLNSRLCKARAPASQLLEAATRLISTTDVTAVLCQETLGYNAALCDAARGRDRL
jgi:hypothetical protein